MKRSWKIRLLRWLTGAVVAVTVIYALVVFIGVALFVYDGGTRVAPEVIVKERFGMEPGQVDGLIGEGDQWIDYHAWVVFTAPQAQLQGEAPFRGCDEELENMKIFFKEALQRYEPARNEKRETVEAYLRILEQGDLKCRELQTTTPQAGGQWMVEPVSGTHFYRAWRS